MLISFLIEILTFYTSNLFRFDLINNNSKINIHVLRYLRNRLRYKNPVIKFVIGSSYDQSVGIPLISPILHEFYHRRCN